MSKPRPAGKELYAQLRLLSWKALWEEEVPRFNHANAKIREEQVPVIRAVGVVFSESGPPSQKETVKQWLTALLADPSEKIRRYAMAALPKIGAGPSGESALLSLLGKNPNDREKKYLGRALNKIGGRVTLETMAKTGALPPETARKVAATVARELDPGRILFDRKISEIAGLQIHLRGRSGLEKVVRDEVADHFLANRIFELGAVTDGLVSVHPLAPFTLGDLYKMRCFGTLGFVLGTARTGPADSQIEEIARLVASPSAKRLFQTLSEGQPRYRIDFLSKGHQRGAVHRVASQVHELCPEILNDSRGALWAIHIYSGPQGELVELSPRLVPDPRFSYRQRDVPAASHPPLAAAMARIAGRAANEVVWDPFCGSGLELIETALRGGVGVQSIYGSDRSADAVEIARLNYAAAGVPADAHFFCCDFRGFSRMAGVSPGSISLIVTNPPMGKRVPITDLGGLIRDLFITAQTMLRPNGRLVFANPLRQGPDTASLVLESRQPVDFGGFECQLEVWLKRNS